MDNKTKQNSGGVYPLIESNISADGIAEVFSKKGFKGALGSVEYGENYPFDAEAWKKVAESFKKFAANNIDCFIYDEFGYPSGTARGAVLDRHPEYAAKGAYCHLYFKPVSRGYHKFDTGSGKLICAVLVNDETGEVTDISDKADENGSIKFHSDNETPEWFISMTEKTVFEGSHCTMNYCEPRKYICISDKRAVEEFIRVTHEKYYEVLGDEFGKGIRAFFTDEPSLIAYAMQESPVPILPWQDSYAADFRQRYGYPIGTAMASVLINRGNPTKIRCDYWEFISREVADGYFKTIKDWCNSHGVLSAGHCLSEENLQWHIVNYGSLYESMKYLDIPGIDMLGTTEDRLMQNCFPFAKLAVSVADVYGKTGSLSEFSDFATAYDGKTVKEKEYYRSLYWHIAIGITELVSLYGFEGLSDETVLKWNECAARTLEIMKRGNRECDVAVLYPITSAWAEYTANPFFYATDKAEGICKLSDSVNAVGWKLLKNYIDYNFIDDDALDDLLVKSGEAVIRGRSYKTIILPCCTVIREKSAEKLNEAIENGVKVIFVGKIPQKTRESGENSEELKTLAKFAEEKRATFISDEDELINAVVTKKSATLSGKSLSVLTHTRTDGNRTILMVANIGDDDFVGKAACEYPSNAKEIDPETGIEREFSGDIRLSGGKATIIVFERKGD
ncbi:MAG: hypothetical protein IJS67_05000 [Clostridia bacterium]|nr:hypothetical protein [Clostridia bacterium]